MSRCRLNSLLDECIGLLATVKDERDSFIPTGKLALLFMSFTVTMSEESSGYS
jgi:hypothetical protein